MGGPGSGSHYHWWRADRKTTVAECLCLDANRWTRDGILSVGVHRHGSWVWTYRGGKSATISYEVEMREVAKPSVRLSYSRTNATTKKTEAFDYRVLLTATRPRFGGYRWWFRCPLLVRGWPCNRRVAKLYLPPGARHFGCRQCHDLTYNSCQESHKHDGLYRRLALDMGGDFRTMKLLMKQAGKRK